MAEGGVVFVCRGTFAGEPVESSQEMAEWAADTGYVLKPAQYAFEDFGGGDPGEKHGVDVGVPDLEFLGWQADEEASGVE